MNKTRQAVETVNFRLYFKVIIRQTETQYFTYSIYTEQESDMLYVTVLCFILSDDDSETKSKIYSLNCSSCFIHILNYKMTLFFGFCFFLYFLKLSAVVFRPISEAPKPLTFTIVTKTLLILFNAKILF